MEQIKLIVMFVWLCLYGYVCMVMFVWLCLYRLWYRDCVTC
jgi:hypothetical protein